VKQRSVQRKQRLIVMDVEAWRCLCALHCLPVTSATWLGFEATLRRLTGEMAGLIIMNDARYALQLESQAALATEQRADLWVTGSEPMQSVR
jgi:hypothetical protein